LNAIAGGADELSRYLDERAAQSFDVVYVDTGVELAIHIDQELPIDYDPNGRKTSYEPLSSSRQTAVD
jgi:ABC-type Fe3+ transport system substrate-binding protein